MNDIDNGRPTPYWPRLTALYRPAGPCAWPLVRVVAGLALVPHGYDKVFNRGIGAVGEGLAKIGYEPGWLWGTALAGTELVGGILLALGLFTRPVALAIAIFMANAVLFHWGNGYFWAKGGFEYPLLWGVVALAFVIRGGGRFSIDAAIGKEF
jgi:putative oxidoreductase